MLRMTYEWQARVEDEGERAHHRVTRAERSEADESRSVAVKVSSRIPQSDPDWCFRSDDGYNVPAEILEAIESLLDYVDAGRIAQADGAIVAESDAGHDRDVGFAEKSIGEILRGQPELADVHQNVERALRFDRGDVRDLRDAVIHVIAPHIELVAHVGERLLVALERGDRALLREGARVRSAVALDRIDRLGDRFRRAHVAEPPARHRVGFAEAVDRDREVVGLLRERRDADVFRVVVNQLLVDLVGENVDVFLRCDLDDRFQFLAAVDRAGRIARAVHDHHLGPRRHRVFKFLGASSSSRCARSFAR